MSLKIKDLESKIQFPVARKHKREGYIVIFSSECKGQVIFINEDGISEKFYQMDSWFNCEDREIWDPVELIITG